MSRFSLLPRLFLLCLAFLNPPFSSAEEIRLGAVVSLTGPAAEQGRNWLDGVELAVDVLKQEGTQVKLMVEDDATQAAKANLAFKKLVSIDRVQGVVGGTWDFTAEAVFPEAKLRKIPFITPTNPVEMFGDSAKGNPYVFTNGLSIAASARMAENFLLERKPKSIAIVVPKVPFGILHADMVAAIARKYSIEVLRREEFEYGGYHDSLRSWALQLSHQKPELIFVIADYGALDIFVSELEKVRFQPILLTTQHLDEAIALSGNPKRYANAFGIYPTPPSREFEDKFIQRFKKRPKVYAAEGYDATRFLAAGIAKKIDFAIPGFSYTGVTGEHTIRATDHSLSQREAKILHTNTIGKLVE